MPATVWSSLKDTKIEGLEGPSNVQSAAESNGGKCQDVVKVKWQHKVLGQQSCKKSQRQIRADELFQKRWCTNLAESKKCQRILAELEQLFGHLETLFSLTLVPRVLLLLGGNTVCPRELYEVNMEGIKVGNGEQSLKTSFCMQKIFRTLFLADVFSDLQSPAIMGAMLLVQGHRDCGIDWFRPKLAYKEPSCSRRLAINLSCCDMTLAPALHEAAASTFQDYIWFQAPVTLKGFHE
ncbi:MAD2L1-binding protein isoform X4 [Microcaecilia unicolor]|uniref:MAD2L1-binding protein isoform X4 n=1 Tax=Microcaecilia unicolor TaxID=1415580 RepID=A0A6P7ZNB5_9AMPH|nr:MAD2L1-binding protein isoform X4 [Microcaecilia unicolor]